MTRAGRREGRATARHSRLGPGLAGALLAACSAPLTAMPEPEPPQAPRGHVSDSGDLRWLPATATYGDLVARIQKLDSLALEDGREACILGRDTSNGAFELRSDLAVAVRPPPRPPADLDAALGKARGFQLLSRYGSLGDEPTGLALVELTPSRPTASAVLLGLTDQGAYLVSTQATAPSRKPVPLDQLMPELSALTGQGFRIELVAEDGLPLQQVDQALFDLEPLAAAVSLATPLPEGTTLPPSATSRIGATCPEGLPPRAEDVPEGSLDMAAARIALGSFSEQARGCAYQAGGRALAGGTLELAMRVDESGRVRELCTSRDDIGEPALGTCLQHVAAALRFPVTGGVVDLALPIRLAPLEGTAPRTVCR